MWPCWQFARNCRVSLATLCVQMRLERVFPLVIFRPSFCAVTISNVLSDYVDLCSSKRMKRLTPFGGEARRVWVSRNLSAIFSEMANKKEGKDLVQEKYIRPRESSEYPVSRNWNPRYHDNPGTVLCHLFSRNVRQGF